MLSRRELRELRAKIGFIYQDFRLVPTLRVLQNVLLGRIGSQSCLASVKSMVLPSSTEVENAYAALKRVGTEQLLYRRANDLSGGEKQRVAIARTLYQQPAVSLADEPVASVDPVRADAIVRLLVARCRQDGRTLCSSLHHIELAARYFDRVIVLRSGRIVYDRRAESVDLADILAEVGPAEEELE